MTVTVIRNDAGRASRAAGAMRAAAEFLDANPDLVGQGSPLLKRTQTTAEVDAIAARLGTAAGWDPDSPGQYLTVRAFGEGVSYIAVASVVGDPLEYDAERNARAGLKAVA